MVVVAPARLSAAPKEHLFGLTKEVGRLWFGEVSASARYKL